MPFNKSTIGSATAFVTITILYIACGKGNLFHYSDKLVCTQYYLTAKPKVYTKNGEITNQAIVKRVLESDTTHTFFENIDTTLFFPKDTITFRSHDTALFKLPRGLETRIVRPQGQYLYFYMTDTALGYRSLIQNSPLKDIVNQIGIYKPYYGDRCPAPIPGYCYLQETFNAFIAQGDSRRLAFPMLTFRLTRKTNNTQSGVIVKNYNNVFDATVIRLLGDGDTLVLQTAEKVYKK